MNRTDSRAVSDGVADHHVSWTSNARV